MAFSQTINTSIISVIVPCYKQAQYLLEALESVWKQTYENWECIIVDDGSPDDTADIALNFCLQDKRFKYLKKENGGLSSARNAGIKEASGELILPLDADDRIHKDYLQLAISAFGKNSTLDLVYCKADFFGEKTGKWNLGPYTYERLLTHNSIFCSAIFKKENFIKAKGYNESLKNGWEDWDLWLRMLNPNSHVLQLSEILFFYRIKEQSMVKRLINGQYQQTKWDVFLSSSSVYRNHLPPPMDLYSEVKLLRDNILFYQQSKEYRLGRLLFKPFRLLKKIFWKH
ncbi:glycosyltransferase family A protein [uncultured Mucilaginibacter sp.]|uniref:glycosyltransferase family 2 protein n=1 Tax=uncultured Mucilaginibacter sp. TaxID=797541 RepID=UPI00260273B9|nr:glycosyltransferase family A protein [uncultured Mucilaginibacter sp.]